MEANNVLDWISNWFAAECNGDWESDNIINIKTVSNPGWWITIDLIDTNLEHLELSQELVELSENDWFFYRIKEGKFSASGDLNKVSFLLNQFKEIVEKYSK